MRDNVIFRDYQHNLFRPLGYAVVTVQYGDRTISGEMYVTDRSHSSVIGRQWLLPLDIIRINEVKSVNPEQIPSPNQIIEDFKDVFSSEGAGEVPDYTVGYNLKKNANPIYRKPRKVPHALLPAANRCIDRLVEQNIFEKVDISEWGLSLIHI